MAIDTTTFIGVGTAFLAPIVNGVTSAQLLDVGQCSKLTLTQTVEKKQMQNFKTVAGGLYKSISKIKTVEVSIDLMEFTKENFTRGVSGTVADVATGTITDEVVKAYKNALVPFAFAPETGGTITVKDNATGLITYVANTDYTVSTAGIRILSTGAIANDEELKVTYTKKPGYLIQALMAPSAEYRLIFEGLNAAESGEPFNVELFKVSIEPSSSLDLLSADFNKLTLKGDVLADIRITDPTKSQFYKIWSST